jgi:PilZ domain-containing protein
MTPALHENRREPRHAAEGAVRVWFQNPSRYEIEGQLVDVSEHGFRMSHQFHNLEAGQTVQFSHPEAAGQARVIWNRIVSEKVETGFLVLV